MKIDCILGAVDEENYEDYLQSKIISDEQMITSFSNFKDTLYPETNSGLECCPWQGSELRIPIIKPELKTPIKKPNMQKVLA